MTPQATSLSPESTVYVCDVQAVIWANCNSPCSEGVEYITSQNGTRRFCQIILHVEGCDEVSYENSIGIQASFFQALSDNIAVLGYGPVCMREFNTVNFRHDAGIKTRAWFESQEDCGGTDG